MHLQFKVTELVQCSLFVNRSWCGLVDYGRAGFLHSNKNSMKADTKFLPNSAFILRVNLVDFSIKREKHDVINFGKVHERSQAWNLLLVKRKGQGRIA